MHPARIDNSRASDGDPPWKKHLHYRLVELTARHRIPGVQLAVYHRGETVQLAVGVERCGRMGQMGPFSTVPVGSITKALTATLAMMLVADGDIELDGPVGEQIPELRGTELGMSLTLRQLLSHTSGLPSDLGEHIAHRRELLDGLDAAALVCDPGTEFSYSNIGYGLVGCLVEQVTGMPWHEAVDSIVLRPLGIDAAFVGHPGPAPTVTGHTVLPDAQVRPVEQVLPPVLAPVGGLALSAQDLVAFGRSHLGKPGLLDVFTAGEMHAAVAVEPFGLAHGWALGLARFTGDGADWLGHDGTADGTSCHLRIDCADECVVALTTNASTGNALWRSLLEELRPLGIEVPPYEARSQRARSVPVRAEHFGVYRNGHVEYEVRRDSAGGACLDVEGEVHRDLTLYDCGTVSVPDPLTGVQTDCGRFLADAHTGEVTALQIGGRLARRTTR